jgi:phasin family protein
MTQHTQPRRRHTRSAGRNKEILKMATKQQQDSYTYLDFAKRAFAPTARFNELVVRNIEQTTRFHYEVAGDLIQATIEQLNAAASTRDFGTLASRQAEIMNRLTDKASKRSHELVKLATETQAQFANWVEEATQVARKAA